MNPVVRRFAREVLTAGVLALFALSATALVVDAVEQARLVATAQQHWQPVLARVFARFPGLAWRVLPLALSLGAGATALRWRQDGRWEACQALGLAPVRLWGVALLAGLVTASVTALGREAVAPGAARVLAGPSAWVQVEAQELTWRVRARRLGEHGAEDVVAIALSDGEAVRVERGHATWDGAGWSGLDAPLPTPEHWRRLALDVGPDAPLARLLDEPSPDRRRAWLTERWLNVLGAALWSGLAVLLTMRRGGVGLGIALFGTAAWRLLLGGLVLGVARGAWPVPALVVVALLPALGLATRPEGRSR